MSALVGEKGRRWRRAVKADIPALSEFLKADEERRVGFSGRLMLGDAVLRLPSPLRGAVWILENLSGPGGAGRAGVAAPAIVGAVLCHPSRLAFPIFPAGEGRDRDLAALASAFAPASVIGMESDVRRYESLSGISPQASVAYRLMSRGGAARSLEPSSPGIGPRGVDRRDEVAPGSGRPVYPGLSARLASPADLDALMCLQEAYEREEVLTSVHEFNLAACRASLARALERQLIYVAEEYGVPVGKAGTNARGFGVDQIGGVYTLPERRGRGVARLLMEELLFEIGRSGKRAALFVKPTNASARALYFGLGFRDVGDYRADYFEP
jgi:GNAT superfamily N-acetyltransferase